MIRLSVVSVFITLFCVSAFAGTNIQFRVGPSRDDSELQARAEFMGSFVQSADKDTSVGAQTLDGKKIFSFRAEGNGLKRRKSQAQALNQIRTWYERGIQTPSKDKNANVAGALRREFERARAGSGRDRNVIVMLNSGIHQGKNTSFVGKYPRDSWANPAMDSPFSAIPNVTGRNVEVVFVTSSDDFTDVSQELKLKRFYALLAENRKARLIGWTDDHDTASMYIRRGNPNPEPAPQAENWDGQLILYKSECEQTEKAVPKQTSRVEKVKKTAVAVKAVPKPVAAKALSLTVDRGNATANVWVTIDPHTISPKSVKAENFRIRESVNSKTREIAPDKIKLQSKSKHSLSVVLLRDVSISMDDVALDDSARGIRAYVDDMKKGDRAALVNFSTGAWIVQDFTSDKRVLKSALDRPFEQSGTALYDSLDFTLNMLEHCAGLGMILGFTDGASACAEIEPRDVINRARDLSAPIFIIGVGDVEEGILNRIAEDSGGMYIPASDTRALEKIYKRISELIRDSFVISYPTSAKPGDDVKVDATVEFQRGKDLFEGKLSSETKVR